MVRMIDPKRCSQHDCPLEGEPGKLFGPEDRRQDRQVSADNLIENETEEELMSIHTQVMNRISEETKKHQCSRAELKPVEKANLLVCVKCAMEVKKICQERTNLLKNVCD